VRGWSLRANSCVKRELLVDFCKDCCHGDG
jgi:hypothetical protein